MSATKKRLPHGTIPFERITDRTVRDTVMKLNENIVALQKRLDDMVSVRRDVVQQGGTSVSGSDYIEVGDGTGGTTKGQVKAKVPTYGTKGLVTTDTSQTIGGIKTFSKTVRIAYDSNGEGTYFPNAIYFKPKEGLVSWISFFDSVTGNNVIAQLSCNSSGRLRLISKENGVNVEVPNTPHIYLYDSRNILFLADIFARYESADGVVHPLILKGDMYGSGTVAQLVIGHDETTGQPTFKISRMPDDTSDVSSRDIMTLGNANDKFLRIANLVAGSNVTVAPDATNPRKLTISAAPFGLDYERNVSAGLHSLGASYTATENGVIVGALNGEYESEECVITLKKGSSTVFNYVAEPYTKCYMFIPISKGMTAVVNSNRRLINDFFVPLAL